MDDKHLDRFAGARKNHNPNDLVCEGDVLVITRRHACWYLSGLLVLLFMVFAAGYFCGKRRALEKFIDRVEQDSLSDQVYYAMGALYDAKDLGPAADNVDTDQTRPAQAPLPASPTSVATHSDASDFSDLHTSLVSTSTHLDLGDDKPALFVAHLMGCGTPKAAQEFVDTMDQHGIVVKSVARQSRTKKGRLITWYQLVTEPLPREVLEPLVERIKRIGKIQNDIKIVEK